MRRACRALDHDAAFRRRRPWIVEDSLRQLGEEADGVHAVYAHVMKTFWLVSWVLVAFVTTSCGVDGAGGSPDPGGFADAAAPPIDAQSSTDDAGAPLRCDEGFVLPPGPRRRGLPVMVAFRHVDGWTNVGLDAQGPGMPQTRFDGHAREDGLHHWYYTLTGFDVGIVTLVFSADDGAVELGRCEIRTEPGDPVDPPGTGAFLEEGGIVVIEVESVDAVEHWVGETGLAGYTGPGYYTWSGENRFGGPSGPSLVYPLQISAAGRYQMRIRNRHDFQDSTEENDVWARMDGGAWTKVFSSQRGEWTWRSNFDLSEHDKPPASYELAAGPHTLELSGRSHGFSIDRIHLFIEGHPRSTDETLPESARAE